MPVAWHLNRWWNFCVPEGEKKEIEVIFTDNAFNAFNLRVLKSL